MPRVVKGKKGQVTTLVLEFQTGGDDLRGGNDNLNVSIYFRTARVQHETNVNAGRRWPNNFRKRIVVSLNQPVSLRSIRELKLSTTFRGGIGGDNWNMDSLKVRAIGNGVNKVIATAGPKRFTGSNRTLTVRARP